ncbi:hypothetical protein Trydic_g8320 [Trypoxylus dichotomus]
MPDLSKNIEYFDDVDTLYQDILAYERVNTARRGRILEKNPVDRQKFGNKKKIKTKPLDELRTGSLKQEPKEGLTCYNCHSPGHIARNYSRPKREIKSYRNGKIGHTSRCCSQPNQTEGVPDTANSTTNLVDSNKLSDPITLKFSISTIDEDIPLVFVQLTKNDESKGIFKVTHVCGINVTVESKLAKKDQDTQCHRCQLYGDSQRNWHAAAACMKCAEPHQTAECTKRRDALAKCALCQDLHTANYKGCLKSLYAKKGGPAQPPKTVAPKPAQRPVPRKSKVSARPTEKVSVLMEVDTPQPSTTTTKPSYAAAVRKSTAKAVKTKTSKKGKTPSAPSLPKPSPKKSVAFEPPTKSTPAIAEEVVDYDASETTSRPETNVLATLSQLIPLIQKIN